MRSLTLALLLSGMLLGCSGEESGKRSSSTNQMEASTTGEDTSQIRKPVATEDSNEPGADSKPTPEIQFERELAFSSTDEVILGDMATFTVDDNNRVYLADGDKTTIHVFNPDGSYLTSLGRQGNGPGEFAGINRYTTMTIHANKLFVTDFSADFPKGVQVFLPDELSFSHTIKLIAENRNDYVELQGYLPKRFFPLNDWTFLVSYRQYDEYENKGKASLVYYVIQDNKGHIVSDPVFKQKGLTYLVYEKPGGDIRRMHSFPFHGKPLLAVSDDDHLYTARTEKFKIEIHNKDGQLVSTIQHPFENRIFDKDEVLERYEETNYMWQLGDGIALEMIREADNLPEEWPALEAMFFDDEDRLWISTIVDDFEIYQWWLLKKSGEVITKFEWPRDHPIEAVRNGYIYTRKTEEETGLQEIVRYRIEIN